MSTAAAVRAGLVVCVLLGAGCGGENGESRASGTATDLGAAPTVVRFRAADGVRLEGRWFGDGPVAVVMSHMGRPGDSQADWFGPASVLARRGFAALTYNRRGVCPGGANGCSKGVDELAESWKDVVGAYELARTRGAERVVLLGASIGAMSSIYAASTGGLDPAGVISIGGVNHASGYDFTRTQVRSIRGPKLFASSAGDIYGGAAAAREWFRWASKPKSLSILPGDRHGTDLLRDPATRRRLTRLVASFVRNL